MRATIATINSLRIGFSVVDMAGADQPAGPSDIEGKAGTGG